jgi:hypothetical protein
MDLATREQLKLLPAAVISKNIQQLGVSQREFAEWFGCANETVSRWVNGLLQSRTNDRFMRAFFACREFREVLRAIDLDDSVGREIDCVPRFTSTQYISREGEHSELANAPVAQKPSTEPPERQYAWAA